MALARDGVDCRWGCYCAQLGRDDAAQGRSARAMTIDEHSVKREVIDDPYPLPLWDRPSGWLWKRE